MVRTKSIYTMRGLWCRALHTPGRTSAAFSQHSFSNFGRHCQTAFSVLFPGHASPTQIHFNRIWTRYERPRMATIKLIVQADFSTGPAFYCGSIISGGTMYVCWCDLTAAKQKFCLSWTHNSELLTKPGCSPHQSAAPS